jgi:ribosomal protein S18 acetylase RimI-like enzyme
MNSPVGYIKIPVKTWFLTFDGRLPDGSMFNGSINIARWENPPVKEYLKIYEEVGNVWGWTGRLLKSQEELEEILQSTDNEVWLFRAENQTAGFFELIRTERETEIVYLGLKPEWIGKGMGQQLIQAAVSIASQNNHKVWLHTCERDHPSALQTYIKAGFKIEKELVSMEYYPE